MLSASTLNQVRQSKVNFLNLEMKKNWANFLEEKFKRGKQSYFLFLYSLFTTSNLSKIMTQNYNLLKKFWTFSPPNFPFIPHFFPTFMSILFLILHLYYDREDRETVAISLLEELNSRLQNRAREVRVLWAS